MRTDALPPEPEFTLAADSLTNEADARPPVASEQRNTSPARVAVLSVLSLGVAAAAIYFLWPRSAPPPRPVVATPPAASPGAPAQPAIQHPIEQISASPATDSSQSPLPSLDASDIVAKDTIETILNGETYMQLLASSGIIRHIVATIDNLPRNKLSTQILPIVPVPGAFATTDSGGEMRIEGGNASRYAAYLSAAESIDTDRLAQFYVRLYPLFQQAYVELGYPNGYFNDRLIDVIDHLLAAPEPKSPVYLSQPKIVFEFTDPGLEALSAGQKVMVRIGIENELRLKTKLREIRKALTGKAAPR